MVLEARGLDVTPGMIEIFRKAGAVKPPFNDEKRAEAGLPADFDWLLAEQAARKPGHGGTSH